MSRAAAVRKGPGKQVTECQNQNLSSNCSMRSTPALRTVKQHVSITGQATVPSIQSIMPQALPAELLDTELQESQQRERDGATRAASTSGGCGKEGRTVPASFNGDKHSVSGKSSYKTARKKLAERSVASHLPRLRNADHKVIIRPKEGLTLTRRSAPVIGGAVRMAEGIPWQKGREEDRIVLKDKGCGVASPPKDHEYTPRCRLRGKEHVPGDKRCKELFRTPYTVKKRQWETKLEEAREQEERRKAEEDTQQHSRTDGVQDRSRRKSKHCS
ncbi:hypothetical protein HPB51_010912 [Rhipicephalus microplus]|uniref:Uncharacterized protein n=1 Tax=Rhipicephalus microplus TaxID=6941 RepID=A0A9J6EGJ1_RHIMP|nr:hypothetical protein HPB51_010912 [Rhipicephalus microplus]